MKLEKARTIKATKENGWSLRHHVTHRHASGLRRLYCLIHNSQNLEQFSCCKSTSNSSRATAAIYYTFLQKSSKKDISTRG